MHFRDSGNINIPTVCNWPFKIIVMKVMKLNMESLGDRFGILFDGRSIDHGHGDTNDAVSGRLNILSNSSCLPDRN